MAILVATHIKTGHERTLPLQDGPLLVGRTTGEDGPGKFSIDFDPSLSRRHFTAHWDGVRLRVQRDPAAKQPVYFAGQPLDDFMVHPGQQFGCAQTRFHVQPDGPRTRKLGEAPLKTFTLPKQGLEFFQQRDTLRPLQALLKLQPLLSSGREPKIFFQDLLPLLADMVPAADEVMALTFRPDGEYEILARFGHSSDKETMPSRTLLRQAVQAGEPVVHLFAEEPAEGGASPTMHAGVLWALAAPIETGEEEAYGIYAIGAESMKKVISTAETPGDLDRAVLGLVSGVVGQYLSQQRLQRLEGQMGNFFSPGLREILIKDPQHSLLELSRHTVTTLFFDLRGFSKATEQALGEDSDEERWEKFLEHFEALKRIMTKVTESVFETEGIVVDYQGDAIFACWGAPLHLDDHARRAVQTAQSTMRRLSEEQEIRHSDSGGTHLPCGIGISSGEVLAGNVGVAGQIHYEIIGRCANVASRLEGLTKYFQVPVLLTLETRRTLPTDVLCRRVARVRPAGMNLPVDVFELVLPRDLGGSGLEADEVLRYEEALVAFETGRMLEAEKILRTVPLEDPVRRFLQSQVGQMLLDGLPPGWDGVINFKRK